MEKRLFNLYLKYIEEHCPSVWARLNKIPRKIKCHMGGMIISYVLALISLYVSKSLNETWALIVASSSILFLISCVVFGLFLFFSTEKYEIDVSDKTIKEYWQYCFGVRNWFLNEFILEKLSEKDLDDNITEVRKRVDLYLLEQAQKIESRNSRIDKWVQALAVPFVLAIITSVLDKSEATVNAISEIFAILLVFVALFGVVWTIYSVVRVFKRQKLEQMKRFSEDLQGALDCQKYAQSIILTDIKEENKSVVGE